MAEGQTHDEPGDEGPGNRAGDRGSRASLRELAALARRSPGQPLAPIPGNVPPAARDFAMTLRVLFGALGMSLNRLAALLHSDPGTVSRYLSGRRIPPPGFIDGLGKAVYEARGSLVTPQVQELVHEQFLAALREHNPARYEVQRLTDLLQAAAREKRQYEITAAALEEAIASRNEKIYTLELEGRQLRSGWAGSEGLLEEERRRRVHLQETLEGLYKQVSYLKEQLRAAQRRAADAEGRCRDLEGQLDAAGALLPDEDQQAASPVVIGALAAQAGWWDRYRDVLPKWFLAFLAMEQAAQTMWVYEAQFIPGVLQSEEYAAAVVSFADFPLAQAEQLVELRKERQRRFREGNLELRVVLDESALRQAVTDTSAQLDHLRQLRAACADGALTLQILPPQARVRAAPNAFSILRFAEPALPDIVYVEHLTGAHYIDQREDVDAYWHAMESLFTLSYGPQRTQELIDQVIDDLESGRG